MTDTAGVPLPARSLPFDRAAVFTIWQGMQYQGGIRTEAQAVLFAQQVLAAHGLGEVPTYGVKVLPEQSPLAPQVTPYKALILLFRENAIPMSDRNSFLWTLIEDGLAAGVPVPASHT